MRGRPARKGWAGAAIAAIACAGVWMMACNVVLGIDDVALGDCHTGEVRCLDKQQPQTCNGDRHWQNDAPCIAQTCMDGRCQGVCLAGTRQCAGTIPQQCQDDGQGFTDEAACPFVCRDGRCTGECVPDPTPTTCLDNTPRNCDDNGAWQKQTPCADQTCQDGLCIGECVAGDKRCAGTTPQHCNTDGQWQDNTTLCDPATEACEGGICVQKCTPGDWRCDNNASQFCIDTGVWQTMTICDPCGDKGCDPKTGFCTLPQAAEGQPCIDDSDRCTLVATCQNQTCTPSLQVKCIDDHSCSNASCDSTTGLCATMDGTACEDNNVCTMQSTCQGGSCNPAGDRAWAHWDLTAPPPSPRFTWVEYMDPGHAQHEVVLDNLTHLLWQRRLRDSALPLLTWEKAKEYCETLEIPGYPPGWRLPTRIDLASLLDYSKAFPEPYIDAIAFPWSATDAFSQTFWSSSKAPPAGPNHVWTVAFNAGIITAEVQTISNPSYNVRCVR